MSGDSGAASEWAVCTGPRPAGGLQRCPPRNWLSCPLAALCGVGGAGSGGGDHSVGTAPCCDGLDAVLPGLFIASGQAAARYGDLAACGVTHVVNAAPSVELCWHKQHLVREGTRRLWGGHEGQKPVTIKGGLTLPLVERRGWRGTARPRSRAPDTYVVHRAWATASVLATQRQRSPQPRVPTL